MSKFYNKILNGDCLKELKKIPDKTFDLVFADPPYNLDDTKYLTMINEIFKKNCLKYDGYLIIEHSSKKVFNKIQCFNKSKKYGDSTLSFFTN